MWLTGFFLLSTRKQQRKYQQQQQQQQADRSTWLAKLDSVDDFPSQVFQRFFFFKKWFEEGKTRTAERTGWGGERETETKSRSWLVKKSRPSQTRQLGYYRPSYQQPFPVGRFIMKDDSCSCCHLLSERSMSSASLAGRRLASRPDSPSIVTLISSSTTHFYP